MKPQTLRCIPAPNPTLVESTGALCSVHGPSASGVKPSISGDLWSDNGMSLFGIYAHGITDMWVMEKALIGLVACEKERHTADNITRSGRMTR